MALRTRVTTFLAAVSAVVLSLFGATAAYASGGHGEDARPRSRSQPRHTRTVLNRGRAAEHHSDPDHRRCAVGDYPGA